ncbi:MAG TPA: hypothetical protein VFH10_15630, partial [Nocardioides sp.]|nr:hypothetical protein [Nocardioides sp.]
MTTPPRCSLRSHRVGGPVVIQVHTVGPEAADDVVGVIHAGFGAREVLDPPSSAPDETVASVATALADHGGLLVTSELGP